MEDRVEGRHAVADLLSSGRPVSLVRVAEAAGAGKLDRIVEDARRAGVRVETVPRRVLDRESAHGAHQGVIAYAEPFAYADLATVLEASGPESRGLLIALDHVTDSGNLGAVVRTAEAVGALCVVVPRSRAASMGPAAFKAAAGAAERVAVCREPNMVRALDAAKEAGWWVVGASEHADTTVWDADLPERMVLVAGSEDRGLARLTERTCDILVRLPVSGEVGSLNVSAAVAVLSYEWVRRWAGPPA